MGGLCSYKRKLNFLYYYRHEKKLEHFIRDRDNTQEHNPENLFPFLTNLETSLVTNPDTPCLLQNNNNKEERINNLFKTLKDSDNSTQDNFLKALGPDYPQPSLIYFISVLDCFKILMGLLFVIGVVLLVTFGVPFIITSNDSTSLPLPTTTSTRIQEIIEQVTTGTSKISTTPEVTTAKPVTTTKEPSRSTINNCISAPPNTRPPLDENQKCPIGTCSFYEFNMIPPPGTPDCAVSQRVKADIDKKPEEAERAQLRIIKCENKCGYYDLELTDFSILSTPYNLLPEKIPKVEILTVANTGVLCEDDDLQDESFNIDWKHLRWLRISNIDSECLEIYKAISSWTSPRLNLLSIENSFISYRNKDHIHEILTINSQIKTLIFINVTFCANCQVFNDVTFKFENLRTIVLTWSPNSSHTQQQTLLVVSKAPNVEELTTNAELSLMDLKWLQNSVHLKKTHLTISLNANSNDQIIQFSLAHVTGFCSLTDLTIKLIVEGVDVGQKIVISVTDFPELDKNSVIKNLTIISEHELQIPGVHKMFRQRFILPGTHSPFVFIGER